VPPFPFRRRGLTILDSNIATTEVIAKGVSPGEHLLHCEIMKETDDPKGSHEMRLIAVDAA
jgi:hypothetical protein